MYQIGNKILFEIPFTENLILASFKVILLQ